MSNDAQQLGTAPLSRAVTSPGQPQKIVIDVAGGRVAVAMLIAPDRIRVSLLNRNGLTLFGFDLTVQADVVRLRDAFDRALVVMQEAA